MSRLKTGSETTPGGYRAAGRGGEVGEGRMRLGEFRARALLVVAGVAAIVGLEATGCDGPGSCARACRPRQMVSWSEPGLLSDGVCICERGGTAPDGGAR